MMLRMPEWLRERVERLASEKRNWDLDEAVRAWERELGIEIGAESEEEAKNLVAEIAYRLYSGAKNTGGRILNFRKVMENLGTKDTGLIALAVAAVGWVIYLLKSKPKREEERTRWPTSTPAQRRVLILVVNARHSEILTTLRTNRVLNPSLAKPLYEATQALWFGTELEFNRSKLRDWFDPARRVAQESEYDVYLVKISVTSDDAGFHRDVTQVERFDAFTRLAERGAPVEVSERLPSEAYGTTEVYRR